MSVITSANSEFTVNNNLYVDTLLNIVCTKNQSLTQKTKVYLKNLN